MLLAAPSAAPIASAAKENEPILVASPAETASCCNPIALTIDMG